MSTVSQPAYESVGSPLAQLVSDGWIATRRNLIKIKRVPEILVFTILLRKQLLRGITFGAVRK